MNNTDFDWDDANVSHIAQHGVKPEEAEEALTNDPLEMDFEITEDGEQHWSYLGETAASRLLYLIITLRGVRIRVVTAFDPPKTGEAVLPGSEGGLKK